MPVSGSPDVPASIECDPCELPAQPDVYPLSVNYCGGVFVPVVDTPVIELVVTEMTAAGIERFRVGPSEAYPVWERYCGERFVYDFMLGVKATPEERERVRRLVGKLLRYQGKLRFATKITGPARIGYLASIFPDAQFVWLVRDGRDFVTSALQRGWFDTSRPGFHSDALERTRLRGDYVGDVDPAVGVDIATHEPLVGERNGSEESTTDDHQCEVRYLDGHGGSPSEVDRTGGEMVAAAQEVDGRIEAAVVGTGCRGRSPGTSAGCRSTRRSAT